MANIIEDAKLIMTDIDANNNKYWYAAVMDDGSYVQENGRVGATNPQRRTKQLGVDSAKREFNKKVNEKLAKGYEYAKVITTTVNQETVVKSNLESVAVKEIEHNTPEVAELIKKISKANIHDIVKASGITYDEKNGDFKTPLGVVTQDGIDEARKYLIEIADLLINQVSYDDSLFKTKTNKYLQIIPQNIGLHINSRFGVKDIFPDIQSIQKQNGILDALDASLQKVLAAPTTTTGDASAIDVANKLFSVKLYSSTDATLFDRINKKFLSTLQNMHTSSSLKLKRIFTVEIDHMKKAFDKKSPSVGNIKELWHGTRTSNLLSILKGGLVIPKSNAPHVCGRMFGDGIYFSDQSTKSLNYSQGYWSRGSGYDNNCYMFLADVAMGKEYIPASSSHNLPKPGYDSTYAIGGKSGVSNNEMIVYSLDQCNLTYLCEFDK